jgi:D-lactate dehydrogenase
LGYDIRPDEESVNKGMIFTDLETIATEAQLVFISLPLNEQTHYLMDVEWLSKLKKCPYIVNVARGKIVHTTAMIDALDNGKVAYYATDVYEKENGVFFYDNSAKGVNDPMLKRLIKHPKVTLTPHQAFVTREAVGEIATTTLRNLDRWSEGKTPSNALC